MSNPHIHLHLGLAQAGALTAYRLEPARYGWAAAGRALLKRRLSIPWIQVLSYAPSPLAQEQEP